MSKGFAGGGIVVGFQRKGVDVADPLGWDETLAGAGEAAGFEKGDMHGDIERGGNVDEGDEGSGVRGIKD